MQPIELPIGWEWKEVRDLTSTIDSGFACSKNNATDDGVVHLRTHNIGLDGELRVSTLVRIPKTFVNGSSVGLKMGDVLFNNTNSVELVGKTVLIREDLPFAFS